VDAFAKSVTFRPDGNGYGTVTCSWEDEPRKQAISLEAAEKFAEGWKAEFTVEAAW
jgi:hypothetical protein